ncbi:MAG: hypothetical protein ACLRTQ_07970 [Candidatus Borkfalkia sp.]
MRSINYVRRHNHVIKNLYAPAYNSGESAYFHESQRFLRARGGSDITFKNITFDSAVAEVQGMDAGRQNLAIVLDIRSTTTIISILKTRRKPCLIT